MLSSWQIALEKLNKLSKSWGFKADLARRLGVTPPVVQKYLAGDAEPGIGQLDRFAAALGMSTWELIKPSNALPTKPKELTIIEHVECVHWILKDLRRRGVDLKPTFYPTINNSHNYDEENS